MDSNGNTIATTITNSSGEFTFNVPAYETYIIQFPVNVPGGNGFTNANVGNETTDSDASGNGQVTITVGNSDNNDVDAGYVPQPEPVDCDNPIQLPGDDICTEAMTPIEVCPDFGDFDPYKINSYETLYNCSLTEMPNGCFIYTPLPGMENIGADFITIYAIGSNGQCVALTINVTIGNCNPNNPPVAVDDSDVSDGSPVTIPVLNNDSDPDGDDLTVIDYTQPSNGTVVLVDGEFIYTPDAGFTGTDTFTYTISDGNGGTDTATVTIVVDGNEPPIANPDNTTTAVNTPVTIPVLPNDSDPDGDNLTVIDFTQPSNGSVVLVDGEFVYTPDAGFTGTDTFTYTISDGNGGTDTTTVTITIEEPQLPPVAVDDSETTQGGTPVTISVLDNDSEPEGENFTITNFTQPSNGTVTLVNGEFVYTPNPDFIGTDTFTYTITDEDGLTSTATVTIVVVDCNNQPEDYCTAPMTPVTICPFFCEFEEGYTIYIDYQITDLESLYGCSTSIISDECFRYMPLPGFVGIDEITVYAVNEVGTVAQTSVFVTVSENCDGACPVAGTACDDGDATTMNDVEDGNCNCIGTPMPSIDANDDIYSTVDNQSITIDVLNNDDYDCSAPSISVVDGPEVGSVLVTGVGIIYIPELGGTGEYTFTYEVCCDNQCDQATVTVNVEAHVPCNVDSPSFRLPNAVTPNGDGVNDVIDLNKVFDECKPETSTFKVFDNLGREVFSQSAYDGTLPQWSAKSKANTELPAGTYFYTLEVEIDGIQSHKKGFIEIRR